MALKRRPKVAPTGVAEVDVKGAHTHSSDHRAELFQSELCGCFHCAETFPADAIAEWTDAVDGVGVTALCPECGIDSVIGSASGYPIERWFLLQMRARWFGITGD